MSAPPAIVICQRHLCHLLLSLSMMQARKDLAKGSVSFSDDKGQEKGHEKAEEPVKALPAPPTEQAGATAAVTLDRAYAKVPCCETVLHHTCANVAVKCLC